MWVFHNYISFWVNYLFLSCFNYTNYICKLRINCYIKLKFNYFTINSQITIIKSKGFKIFVINPKTN